MDKHSYDAIVVGSGITGGWAAKELAGHGLRTLVVERGRNVVHGKDYVGEGRPPYSFRFHMLGDQRLYASDYPVQSRIAHFSEATSQFFVNDRLNPYTHAVDKPFTWVRGHQLGGRSLTWGRQSYRMGAVNFEENARDGHGVDWPVRYSDLEPWYAHVERFIGVSGEAIGSAASPDGVFQPPMGMNPPEREFAARIHDRFPDRRVTVGRLANLTESLPGRGPCQQRNACARGCSWGGYFSTLSSTLPAARATGRLTVRTDSIVHSVIYDPKTSRATGVRVIDAVTRATTEYRASVVFLCASAFESVRILFNSANPRFPTGLANSSDTLGRYVMDHFPSELGLAEVDGPEMPYFDGGRPGPLLIPRFRNIDRAEKDYVRGYQMHAGAAPAGWNRALREPGVGASLKARMRKPGPWTQILIAQGEMLPNAENRVTLDPTVKDAWDMPAVRISVAYGDNEAAMRKDATQTVHEMFDAAGYRNYRVIPIAAVPGEAIHEMGGARMGRDPKTSVLNGFNQAHDVPNLFVTDGAAMASSSSANPSLTYMALTARACAHAVDELKRRNL
jgi:choline dehydrogenase-like flavoprotein